MSKRHLFPSMGSSSGSLFFKVLIGAIAMVGFVWVLLVGTLESGATRQTTTTSIMPTKDELVVGKEKLVYVPELDFNYMMSKRKVPNGPDPIHNRRAGNSKRPPGRS
uniref:CLAVATA3/ESR (CLE)-related protein 25 n=1 Tax=Rhizophora mucronata TaxID=61149 RepID=A0A2P2NNP3_RHIMU